LALKQDAAEIAQNLTQIGIEAGGSGTINHAVVPSK
jgi:hypothetical protein